MKPESVFEYVEDLLGLAEHADYPTALNGMQVEGRRDVRRLGAAVDVSEEVIEAAIAADVDLLLVHHGLFWSGLQPLRGRLYRKVARLVESGMALVSVHLPLDSHPDLGNCALLARALGIEPSGRFGTYQGEPIGWWGELEGMEREALRSRVSEAVGGDVHLIAGGPARVDRIGVLTGGGGSFVEEAARVGLDAYVTGEGSHHTYVDAMELGLNLYYAGHYATETFGVKALAAHLAERFGLSWEFLDFPSGL